MNSIWARLGRGFFYSLLGQGASYAIAFLLAPIYARALAPEQFAVVSFANSLRNVLMMLMPMGVGGAVVYWYNRREAGDDERRKNIGGISTLALIYSGVWLLAFVLAGKPLIEKLFGDVGIPFFPYGLLIGGSAFLMSVATVPTSLLVAEEKIGMNALLASSFGLLQTGLIIIFVVTMKRGANGQMEAMFLAGVLSAIVYGWLIFRRSPFRFDQKLFGDVSRFSIPLLPHSLFMWILNLSDRMIISYYGKGLMRDMGFYSFGYTIAMVMQGVMGSFNTIWSAVFMKEAGSREDARDVLGKVASYAILMLSLAGTGLIMISPELISLLSGGRYDESAKYVPPVVLGYFFQGVYMFPGMALYHLKKTYLFPVITGSSAFLNIAINIYGVPKWGVMTAAWSTAIGFFVMAAMSFLLGHFPFPLKYRPLPLILSTVFFAVAFASVYSGTVNFVEKCLMIAVMTTASALLWMKDFRKEQVLGA